jgi:hypothetical protein
MGEAKVDGETIRREFRIHWIASSATDGAHRNSPEWLGRFGECYVSVVSALKHWSFRLIALALGA